jgi:outer membrane immunogenic protein
MTGEGEVKKFLLAGIAFGALVLPAAAADMPVKALPPAPIDIWTGGYVGVNVGYGWGSDYLESHGDPGTCTAAVPGCTITTAPNYSQLSAQAATYQTSINHNGVVYGGQAGHNWLVHNIAWTWDGVLGVEVDFQGVSDSHSSSISSVTQSPGFPAFPVFQTATTNAKIDTLGTLRGRAGLLWGPNTLLYVTGGLAFASTRVTTNIGQNVIVGGLGPYNTAGQTSTELFGPVVGGGIEWKWTANWSVKAEYLYADLGNVTLNTNALINPEIGGIPGNFSVANVNQTVHVRENIARVGFNYRFW